MDVKKKAWKEMFEEVKSGKKNFDVRLDEPELKDLKEGDYIVLEEWDEKKGSYTGRSIRKKISYVLRTKNLKFWKKEDIDKNGFFIMGLKD